MILKQAKQNGMEAMAAVAVVLLLTVPAIFLPHTRQYIIEPENGTPLFNTLYGMIFGGTVTVWTQIASLLAMTAELSVLVLLNSDFELTRAKPSLFALVFLPMTLSLVPCNTLLPEQIANIFIALGLIKVFACHSMDNASWTFFDAGLFFGIATLFCTPAAVMLVIGLIAVMVFRPIKGGELSIFVVGFLTPITFYLAVYYLVEGTLEPLSDYLHTLITVGAGLTVTYNSIICIAVSTLLLIIASVMILNEYPKYNLFSSRAYRLLLIMFLIVVGSTFFLPYFSIQALRLTAIPVTILYVTVFHDSKPSLWLDIFFVAFIVLNIALQILWYRL